MNFSNTHKAIVFHTIFKSIFYRLASLILFNDLNINKKVDKLCLVCTKVLQVVGLIKNEFLVLGKYVLDENINLDSDNKLINIARDVRISYFTIVLLKIWSESYVIRLNK